MADWGDGLPFGDDAISGEWGDGLPFGPAEPAPPPVVPVFVCEILIGNLVVWTSGSNTAQTSLQFDVSNYTGIHKLKFRLRRIS